VVIAIIGILAGIVLVALGGARDRAKDARIQAGMTQIRVAGELFNSSNNTFTGLCGAGTDVATLQTDIISAGVGGRNFTCNISTGAVGEPAAGTAYCIYVQLNDDSYWCVDFNLVSANIGASAPATCAVGATHVCQ